VPASRSTPVGSIVWRCCRLTGPPEACKSVEVYSWGPAGKLAPAADSTDCRAVFGQPSPLTEAVALAVAAQLSGPAEDDRTALAIACATRHIGIAVLVAASVPGPRTSVLVTFYILTSAVISIPYLRWRRASISQVRPHRPNEARASPAN
jgi:hypothetical protein